MGSTARVRVVATVLAVAVPAAIALVFGPGIRWLIIPASLMFLTVVGLTFLGGARTGVVAAVAATLSLWFVNVPPGFSLRLTAPDDAVAVVATGSVSTSLALMTDWLRRRERDAIARSGALERARAADGETILALQQAVLPTIVPAIAGVSVVASYHVGGEVESPVGGDWFAYLPLDGGRIGVAVGDVVGHGIQAVASMAEYRYTFRAIAAEGVGPDVALNRLEELSARLGRRGVFTTCLYVIVDPEAASVQLSSAGHPPPVLVRGSSARAMEGRGGPPIGAVSGHAPYGASTFELRPGDRLALYTDGVVERRGEPIDRGIERLGRTLVEVTTANGTGVLDAPALDSLIERLVGPHPGDDSALVLISLTAQEGVPADA